MNGLLSYYVEAIVIYSAMLLSAVGIERWLVKRGFVRDKTYLVVLIGMSAIVMKELGPNTISWLPFVFLAMLAMILGGNRADLWTTANKGKWWWKQNEP